MSLFFGFDQALFFQGSHVVLDPFDLFPAQATPLNVYCDAGKVGRSDLTFGRMAHDDVRTFSVEIGAGGAYMVQADCGQTCSNLDLIVSETGQQLGADLARDSIPEVAVAPNGSAGGKRTLGIEVKMPGCYTSRSCPFVMGVYRTD